MQGYIPCHVTNLTKLFQYWRSSSIQSIGKTQQIDFVTLRADHNIKYSKTK